LMTSGAEEYFPASAVELEDISHRQMSQQAGGSRLLQHSKCCTRKQTKLGQ
jgi:hypothetical protein